MMHYLVYNGLIPESNLLQKKSIANAQSYMPRDKIVAHAHI